MHRKSGNADSPTTQFGRPNLLATDFFCACTSVSPVNVSSLISLTLSFGIDWILNSKFQGHDSSMLDRSIAASSIWRSALLLIWPMRHQAPVSRRAKEEKMNFILPHFVINRSTSLGRTSFNYEDQIT